MILNIPMFFQLGEVNGMNIMFHGQIIILLIIHIGQKIVL